MPRTKRGLKKARSQQAQRLKQTKFTAIIDRQNRLCWFCNEHMEAFDISKEHVFSQALGGTNDDPPGNLVAAHRDCNSAAGHLPVEDKYRLRSIGHTEGRKEMLHIALQMRRADARIAFSNDNDNKLISKPKPKGFWKSRSYMRM